ncbi:beta-lactamase [Sphaerisporangium melleum]|uniref:Beta-lactamase n=1 Tax=Sphaerisporangium melleum TaxID=321316 RepID=A0A917RJ99_9ACTN|nr:class A beta-lactamase [Sphaerisporangium melleum]GGL10820.1 beta-lactamase [Sphaerisporangium melleum]GII69099.1 beta-lactamase [Sphaerisporangium melleum]
MRFFRAHRFGTTVSAGVLGISVLAGGSAYGSGSAWAAPYAAAEIGHASPVQGSVRTAVPDRPLGLSPAKARRELRALETAFKARIGAYVIDTATGKTFGYRSGERFPLLSTFKAMACAAVLKKARTSDPGLMGRVVRWTKDELKENSPVTEKHVHDGMTVAELCRAAITYSDNTAGNMILKQIGGPKGLTAYFRTLKDPVSRLDRWETELNEWTPKERRDTTRPAFIARDLGKVAVGTALDDRDEAQLNAWLLANTTGGERIRAGLPKSWIIGDKTGSANSHGAANDIAVVRTSPSAAPLIMAIYTNARAAGTPYDNKLVARTATILARAIGKLP